MKQAPAISPGINNKIRSIMISSTETRTTPILIPALSGMPIMLSGLPFKDANAVLALARVFILIPNQATPYEPRIPITDIPKIINTFLAGIP